jgi:D-glycero-alpha-D-manno-heptose-7-phosphate kinase
MRKLTMRAPTRLDFGGGWTDVPPYDVEQGGFVCNVAIARYATVHVSESDDPHAPAELAMGREGDVSFLAAVASKYDLRGARVSLTSDFPVAAGLGGSSAAGVAAIAAALRWGNVEQSRAEIAEASRDLEVLQLGIAGGRQDHYAAAFGGALGIRFGESVVAERIPMSAETVAALPRHCIVLYTGESRVSANTITAVMDAYRAGRPAVRDALAAMRDLAEQMAPALSSGDFELLGRLVGAHWRHQRSLDPAIPTPLIDRIIAAALAGGATGCKALGASGGGCVLMIAPEDRAPAVRAAVDGMGTEIIYAVDTTGVTETH